jgi:ribosomal protein S27E
MVYLFTSKRDLPQGEEAYPQYWFSKEEEQLLRGLPPPILPPLAPQHGLGSLASLRGDIVAVDEDSAFSWTQCDKCGNEQLSTTTTTEDGEDDGLLYCDECNTKVLSPSIHLQLAVYVKTAHDDSCRPVCVQGEETYPQYWFSKEEEQLLRGLPPPILPPLAPQHGLGSLASLRGDIVAVDEDSAFSWTQCDKCGNEQLSTTTTTEDGRWIVIL